MVCGEATRLAENRIRQISAKCRALLVAFLSFGGVAVPHASVAADGPLQTGVESYGAWMVRCTGAAPGSDEAKCEATLRITNRGAEIAQLAFGRLGGSTGLIVAGRTPLGVVVSEPMRLASDNGENPIEVTYSTCVANGCVAQTMIEAGTLTSLLSSEPAFLSFRERSGRVVKIAIPLKGLTEALARLGVDAAG